jgi:hypothetical protein
VEEFAADVSKHTMIFTVHLVKEDGRVTITVNRAQVRETALLERYQDFQDVFLEVQAAILAPHRDHDHAIDLEPGQRPLQRLVYSLLEWELEVLREYINKALEKGWI